MQGTQQGTQRGMHGTHPEHPAHPPHGQLNGGASGGEEGAGGGGAGAHGHRREREGLDESEAARLARHRVIERQKESFREKERGGGQTLLRTSQGVSPGKARQSALSSSSSSSPSPPKFCVSLGGGEGGEAGGAGSRGLGSIGGGEGGVGSIKVFLASPLRPSQLPATDRGAGTGAGADAPAIAPGEWRLGASDGVSAGAWRLGSDAACRLGQPPPVEEVKELRGVEYQAAFGGLLRGVRGAGQGEDLAARASEVLTPTWCTRMDGAHGTTRMHAFPNVALPNVAPHQKGPLLLACVTCGAIWCA